MSTKTVDWLSDSKLPCSCQGTVNVIVCTRFNATVTAQIIDTTAASSCEVGEWKYQLQYDSTDLPEGVTALATSDISSVACKGCLATWIEEQIDAASSQAVVEYESESSLDFGGQTTGTEKTLTLIVANPSDTQTLKGALHWAWSLNVQAATQFDAGISSEIKADGNAIPDSDSNANFTEQVPGGIDQFIAGVSGFIPYDLDPGESVIFTLVLTSSFGNEPDEGFVVSHPRIMYSGVTVPV